jgi:hypothetical protein
MGLGASGLRPTTALFARAPDALQATRAQPHGAKACALSPPFGSRSSPFQRGPWPTLMLRIGAFRALIGSVTPASRVPPHGGAYLAGPGNRLLSDDIVTGPGTGIGLLGLAHPTHLAVQVSGVCQWLTSNLVSATPWDSSALRSDPSYSNGLGVPRGHTQSVRRQYLCAECGDRL